MTRAMSGIPHFEPIEAEANGHKLKLFVSGQDRLAALIELIDSAQKTLRLFFYIFGDDDDAQRVMDALVAARGRGVKVWLLVDGFGCDDRKDEVYEKIIASGVLFARFYPRWGRRYLLRNHQKIVLADGKVALIGGTNVVAHYFADAADGSSWHDLFLRLEGPAAERLCGYFDGLRRWMMSERPKFRGLTHILARRSEREGDMRWLFNGPFRRISPLTQQILRDIDKAGQLDTIQAYFSPRWGILRRIGRIVKRGGRAHVVTAARSDNTTTIAAARHCYRRLLRSGVAVSEYTPQMLHMKLLVIDDATYIGSANFDMRSMFINAEIMLRIEDKAFAEAMRGLIAAHAPHCQAITRESHHRASNWLARARWLFSYFVVSSVDFTVTRSLSLRRR